MKSPRWVRSKVERPAATGWGAYPAGPLAETESRRLILSYLRRGKLRALFGPKGADAIKRPAATVVEVNYVEENKWLRNETRREAWLDPAQVTSMPKAEGDAPPPYESRDLSYLASTGPAQECPSCAGTGALACNDCDGAGRTMCEECGTKDESESWCPRCRAKGFQDQENCSRCDGAGVIRPCAVCGGSRSVLCAGCGGRGSTPCRSCRGTARSHFCNVVEIRYTGTRAVEWLAPMPPPGVRKWLSGRLALVDEKDGPADRGPHPKLLASRTRTFRGKVLVLQFRRFGWQHVVQVGDDYHPVLDNEEWP